MAQGNYNEYLGQLENTLSEYFGKKAPSLPSEAKEIIVKIAPFLAIIGVVLSIPAILVLLGLGGFATMLSPFGGMTSVGALPTMWLGIILLIPVVILEVMAIPGLFARSAQAWRYMYWAQLISVVSSLVQLNILGAIIGALVGFYLLFQVRSYYK